MAFYQIADSYVQRVPGSKSAQKAGGDEHSADKQLVDTRQRMVEEIRCLRQSIDFWEMKVQNYVPDVLTDERAKWVAMITTGLLDDTFVELSMPSFMPPRKKARGEGRANKVDVMNDLVDKLNMLGMQARALGDADLIAVLTNMMRIKTECDQDPNKMAIMLAGLELTALTKLNQLAPGTHNEPKMAALYAYLFTDEEITAQSKMKVAKVCQELCETIVKYCLFKGFMTEQGTVKWTGEENTAFVNVIASIMMNKAHALGRQEGVAGR
jgi:hypothetical protein